jgi:signal transduction histidine kinase
MATRATESAPPPVDLGDYAQAITNMLEDLSLERERMLDGQRATVNILEDFGAEKAWLEKSQAAMLNILADASEEQARLQQNQRAILNILEDLEDERENVRQRTEELVRSNRNLGAFTYSVAHDLRAPLRAMSGFSEALLDEYGDRLDDVGRGYAERVHNASTRMAALIDDLLDLARLTRAELHREPTDISEMIRAVVADVRAQDPERRAVVDIEAGITAKVDPRLFRTVFENLLDNAWKFSAKRKETRIEFSSTPAASGTVGFLLRDNGAGFDPAYADKLFQPFGRLHSDREYQGTGIGLASAREVVERHGGTIRAESEPDRGASFYIVISDTR